jgi:molybdate transport system permease protein
MLELTAAEIAAIELSLRVGLWAVAGSLVPAVAAAWLLARRQFPGKLLLDGLIHLPLVVPPVVIGYVLLVLLGRNGPLGRLLDDWFGIALAFTWQGAAVAAAVMGFPLMVRAMRLSLEAVDTKLEAAARTLGAPPWQVFATVTLPLMAPGILAGAILGFARALGEFGATITFVSNIPGETRTLPLALYTFTQTPGGDLGALRLAVVSVALALVALGASELLARRLHRRLGG